MTVDEFRMLPRPIGPFDYELHDGLMVPVPRPKIRCALLQRRLCDLLEPLAPAGSYVDRLLVFRSAPEFDLRVADVGYVKPQRHATVDMEDNFHGAPDLAIEVLSAAKSEAEVSAKQRRCLQTGALEFWVVDPKNREVHVSSANQPSRTYKPGQSIPLTLFGNNVELPIDAIFANIP